MLPSRELRRAAEPAKTNGKTHTPAMRQYLAAKKQYPDAIVFFRMGDFYEMFYDDAIKGSEALELTLTSRSKNVDGSPIPMCGVPHHASATYILRLVKRGYRVAICEQVESSKQSKTLVKREVVRVVSPGTLTDANYLESEEAAFLMAIVPIPNATSSQPSCGVATADISTGEFHVTEYSGQGIHTFLSEEIVSKRPREILLPKTSAASLELPEIPGMEVPITVIDDWTCSLDHAQRALIDQFRIRSLEVFGLTETTHPAAIRAAGALIQYLKDTQKADLIHFRDLQLRLNADYLLIDPTTFDHLEVLRGSDGTRNKALVSEIDETLTAMGARLFRSWFRQPLATEKPIAARLEAVEELFIENTTRAKLRSHLKSVRDLERLVARLSLGTANARDLATLGDSLKILPSVRTALLPWRSPLMKRLCEEFDDLQDVCQRICRTISDQPPVLLRDGGTIRNGADNDLDELRSISLDSKTAIANLEAAERERTGIASLKVGFNRVFGYYIEVTKKHVQSVPDEYHRKQTIANGERFVTDALKQHERKVLDAGELIIEREQLLFEQLRQDVLNHATRIQRTARSLAEVDALSSLSECATLRDFTKPEIHTGNELFVQEGRHPVVELTSDDSFVPNDVKLNDDDHQLVVLTGPNMGGKSTYLRQTALIALMAHVGSFVPAKRATVPLMDRIFARVGASDNIARGQSTFMIEMEETAKILHMATTRSLVLLDEVGRGTATFDGLSIAWAVAERLVTNPKARPKTLFATHYHELTDLADTLAGVANYHVAAQEMKEEIIFLRKVQPGRSDRSYGIQVARLAGLPEATIERAKEILTGLERDELSRGGRPSLNSEHPGSVSQPGLFRQHDETHDSLRSKLNALDLNSMTPIEAFTFLAELKEETKTE